MNRILSIILLMNVAYVLGMEDELANVPQGIKEALKSGAFVKNNLSYRVLRHKQLNNKNQDKEYHPFLAYNQHERELALGGNNAVVAAAYDPHENGAVALYAKDGKIRIRRQHECDVLSDIPSGLTCGTADGRRCIRYNPHRKQELGVMSSSNKMLALLYLDQKSGECIKSRGRELGISFDYDPFNEHEIAMVSGCWEKVRNCGVEGYGIRGKQIEILDRRYLAKERAGRTWSFAAKNMLKGLRDFSSQDFISRPADSITNVSYNPHKKDELIISTGLVCGYGGGAVRAINKDYRYGVMQPMCLGPVIDVACSPYDQDEIVAMIDHNPDGKNISLEHLQLVSLSRKEFSDPADY